MRLTDFLMRFRFFRNWMAETKKGIYYSNLAKTSWDAEERAKEEHHAEAG